jgi:hypothetical protein
MYSDATRQKSGPTLPKGSKVKRIGYSIDGKVSMIKTSTGRTYYVDSSYLSYEEPVIIAPTPAPTPVPTPTPTPAPTPDTSQQQNNNNNNNNSNNNNNNGGYNSGGNNNDNNNNNNGGYTTTYTPCTGVCFINGCTPDKYINGVAFCSRSFTAYITQTTYLYSTPAYSTSTEWLATGTELNCTAIGENNFVQVLLANGSYAYIDGNCLRMVD